MLVPQQRDTAEPTTPPANSTLPAQEFHGSDMGAQFKGAPFRRHQLGGDSCPPATVEGIPAQTFIAMQCLHSREAHWNTDGWRTQHELCQYVLPTCAASAICMNMPARLFVDRPGVSGLSQRLPPRPPRPPPKKKKKPGVESAVASKTKPHVWTTFQKSPRPRGEKKTGIASAVASKIQTALFGLPFKSWGRQQFQSVS